MVRRRLGILGIHCRADVIGAGNRLFLRSVFLRQRRNARRAEHRRNTQEPHQLPPSALEAPSSKALSAWLFRNLRHWATFLLCWSRVSAKACPPVPSATK